MAHPNTRLSPHSRRLLVNAFLAGIPMKLLAVQYDISKKTGYGWVRRYQTEGLAGLENRTSRPQRNSPRTSMRMGSASVTPVFSKRVAICAW